MNAFTLKFPYQITAGDDSILQLAAIVSQAGVKRAVVLTDDTIFHIGLTDKAQQLLREAGADITVIHSVPPEPRYDQVMSLYGQTVGSDFDLFVGIGGGSVMDVAKILSVLATNPEYAKDLTDAGRIAREGKPTVMIPTTAGTGSETTINAIFTIPDRQLKYGVVSDKFMPTYVLLDPDMTAKLPKPITASTGMDAFCHAIECFISRKSNSASDELALRAIRLISQNLPAAFRDGSDKKARLGMMIAATIGGMCISSSGTTAVHALSYPLGGRYRIPHGISNAILLPSVMEYNRDAVEDKLCRVAEAMALDTRGLSRGETARKVIAAIYELEDTLQIQRNLLRFGVTEKDIPSLSAEAHQVRRLLDNNPKDMSVSDIAYIYRQVL